MLVLFHEELRQDIRAVEHKVYDFLEIDTGFHGKSVQNHMVAPYLHNPEKLASFSAKVPGFDWMWKRSRHFRNLFLDANSSKKNKMAENDRNYLCRLYSEPTQLLENYLNTDLTSWQMK